MQIQALPNPPAPPKGPPTPPPHKDHTREDGIQIGHDAASLGEHGLKTRWLGELTRDEMVEMRALVAREGRQTAVIGETAHFTPHSWLKTGVAGLNGVVAASALWHGVEMLRSKDGLHKIEGVNHLLMGAGCGLISGHLLGGDHHLGEVGSKLMVAHGVGEIGIGAYRAIKRNGPERVSGLLQAAHGACLVGAELVHGAAVPLCLAMAGITGAQIWLHRKHPHQPESH